MPMYRITMTVERSAIYETEQEFASLEEATEYANTAVPDDLVEIDDTTLSMHTEIEELTLADRLMDWQKRWVLDREEASGFVTDLGYEIHDMLPEILEALTDQPQVSKGRPYEDDMVIRFGDETQRDNVWITIHLGKNRPTMSLNIIRTDDGVVFDAYPYKMETDNSIVSMYCFDSDVSDAEKEN